MHAKVVESLCERDVRVKGGRDFPLADGRGVGGHQRYPFSLSTCLANGHERFCWFVRLVLIVLSLKTAVGGRCRTARLRTREKTLLLPLTPTKYTQAQREWKWTVVNSFGVRGDYKKKKKTPFLSFTRIHGSYASRKRSYTAFQRGPFRHQAAASRPQHYTGFGLDLGS
jgi:hypothetical protein